MELEPVQPKLDDGYGYRVCISDLDFLGLSPSQVREARSQKCPLGMTPTQFDRFLITLERSLMADGIDDAEVRLQGSSAHFFSGHHKSMVYERGRIATTIFDSQRRLPDPTELDSIMQKQCSLLWEDRRGPHRRPFDSFFRLGITSYPSDYDVQISSNSLYNKVVDSLTEAGLGDELLFRRTSRKYAYIRNRLVAEVCKHTVAWQLRQSSILHRPVEVAAFPAAGPPEIANDRSSSHHRTSDWVIRSPTPSSRTDR